MDERAVTKQLVRLGWSELQARVGLRADFRCEYSDRDFLSSVDDYKSWHVDHIVPVSRGGLEGELDNLAAACRTCNFNFKSDWDPRSEAGQSASREELIAATRHYIAEKRVEALEHVLEIAQTARVTKHK